MRLTTSLRELARTLKMLDMPNYAKVCRDAAKALAKAEGRNR
jgi:hypothetical protein